MELQHETEQKEKFFAYLTKRPCTRKQAEEYLTRQRIHEDIIEVLMNEAESYGMIDDLAYAKLFADGHLSWGNLKIAYELGMKGISREDIESAFEEIDDEETRATELAESWRKSGIDDRKIRSRLINRGFTNRSVRSI